MQYRAEIDGLRALAVIPVIFFHAGFEHFRGGFLGVDIFFVISGYLISGIIFNELSNKKFSLYKFYIRRAKRILPALFFILIIFFIIFWQIMLPWDYENYGAEAVASILFSNNIFHYLTSGNYWGTESEFKALLHTWSLGVEEQFYIIFPLLALLLSKFKSVPKIFVIGFLFLVSLFFYAYFIEDEMLVFFLSPFRAWELLAGTLISIYTLPKINNEFLKQTIPIMGLILIFFAFNFASKNSLNGINNYLVIIGTMIIIMFASNDTFVGRILSLKPIVGIGLISFSLYLWHQPIFVSFRILSLSEPEPFQYLPYILLSIILSIFSWHYIENFFRYRWKVSNKIYLTSVSASACIMLIFGLYIYNQAGISHRWEEYSISHNKETRNANVQFNNSIYRNYVRDKFPDNDFENVLILGNSFARDFVNAAIENDYFNKHNIAYENVNLFGCLNSRNVDNISPKILSLIKSADHLILPSAEKFKSPCAKKDILFLSKTYNVNTIVVGTKNFGWSTAANLFEARKKGLNTRVPVIKKEENESYHQAMVFGDKYVNTLSLISDENGNVPIFDQNGNLLSFDTRHLTPAGARFLGKLWFDHPLLEKFK